MPLPNDDDTVVDNGNFNIFFVTLPMPLLCFYVRRLLKRNASDRIEFPSFFNHPFVTKYAKPKASAPVAVPSPRGTAGAAQEETDSCTDSASTSSLQAVSVSPLSTMRVQTPPYRDARDTPPSPNTWNKRNSGVPHNRAAAPRPDSEVEHDVLYLWKTCNYLTRYYSTPYVALY